MESKKLGIFGEELAIRKLQELGHKIIDRNFHSKFGEIDIISKKDNCLVFTEVKTRKTPSRGSALESVNKKKLEKLILTANYYLLKNNIIPEKQNCRIDLIAIEKDKKEKWSVRIVSDISGF